MKLALLGYGRMGRAVEAAALARGDSVVTVVDDPAGVSRGALGDAEVAVDFSTPGAAIGNIGAAAAAGLDVVVGTTGWYDRMEEARAAVRAAGTGLVWAPNFSLGVQLFLRLAARAARLVDALDGYDIAVHETHHRHKLDHPSGTALALARVLVDGVGRKERWAAAPPDGAADPSTLWVSSARVGEVPGTHVVSIEGADDGVELRHTARGRGGFARGAVEAAHWVKGRPGFHDLEAMLADRFGRD